MTTRPRAVARPGRRGGLRRAGVVLAAALALGACSSSTATPEAAEAGTGAAGRDGAARPAAPEGGSGASSGSDTSAGSDASSGSDTSAGSDASSGSDAPAGSDTSAAATVLGFSAPSLSGGTVDAAELAGEPVVLWFWAPWCTICRAEAPEVAEVAAELEGTVRVLGVPGLGPEADMRAFVADTGTGGLTHLVDGDGSLWQRFGVVHQPAFAFVSPDGDVETFGGALGGDELRTRALALAAG